jgi:hypothetical protein
MTAVSARAYAKHRRVSVSAVVKWKKLGRVLVLPSGQIDVESSDAMLAARPEVYRGGVIGGTPKGGGAGSQGSKATARAIATKETYLALSHKLDYERAVGRTASGRRARFG